MKVLDESTPAAPRSPAGPIDREWSDDRELDMFSGVMFLWRYRYALVAAVVIGAALGFLVVRMKPVEYSAISTVFVNIPRTQNPLAPDPLSVEAVDRLANSELMQSQVSAELRKRAAAAGDGSVLDLSTVLYRSTDPAKPYLPLLGLMAVASSPELAREAANVWATVLTEETRRLAAATRASAVDFIVTEYPRAAQRLSEQERSLEALKREHAQAMQSVKNSAAVSLKEEQLWSREQRVVELEEQRNRLAIDLKEVEARVSALEQELKQVPAQLPAGGLFQSQQVNPVHAELTGRLADARVRRTELLARRPALEAQLDEARRSAAAIRASLGGSEVSIGNLERQQQIEIAAKEREVESARANFKKLEEQIGDAQIVKADSESSLTLGAPAELPGGPSGPQYGRTVGLAALAALAIALVAAWIMDRARARATESAATARSQAARP
jgi:uncharacterized protein involved in exopolysaccharide biosynthesis